MESSDKEMEDFLSKQEKEIEQIKVQIELISQQMEKVNRAAGDRCPIHKKKV